MHRAGGPSPRCVVALAIQVGTNYANDYSDGMRGTDDVARRPGAPGGVGPGGAGRGEAGGAGVASAWPPWPAWPWPLATSAGGSLLVGAASHRRRLALHGRPEAVRLPGLGELFVFVFFGLVATVGSTYVQIERLTGAGRRGRRRRSGLLATALLVVNNLRDIPTDTRGGQAHPGRAPRRRRHPRSSTSALRRRRLRASVSCSRHGPVAGAAGACARRRPVRGRARSAGCWRAHGAARSSPCSGGTARLQLVFGASLARLGCGAVGLTAR